MKRRANFSETSHVRGLLYIETPARDKDLVVAFNEGDLTVFSEIYSRYRSDAYRICRRYLRNPDDAEEAVQEVMLRTFRGLARFDGKRALGAWVRRIARNLCLDLIRSRARRGRLEKSSRLEELDVIRIEEANNRNGQRPNPNPSDVVEALLDSEEVRKVLAQLPDHHRAALVLREFEGRSHEEIATVLGISNKQAKALIHRAKRSFRRAWGDKLRRGLAALLPPFLAPLHLVRALLHRAPEVEVHAGAASVSPSVHLAVSAAGERVSVAMATVLVTGVVGLGVSVPQADSTPTPSKPARVATPAAAPPIVLPTPGATQEETAVPDALPSPQPSPSPASSEASSTDPSAPSSPDPSPEPNPSPSPAFGPAPAWSFGFQTSVSSTNLCGYPTEALLQSSTTSGQAGSQLGFVQQVDGAALDAEGDRAWRLWLEFAGQAGSSGSVTVQFQLHTAEGRYDYTASGEIGAVLRTEEGGFTYTYSGSYSLAQGPTTWEAVPREGTFTLALDWWADGTSLYRVEFSLQEH